MSLMPISKEDFSAGLARGVLIPLIKELPPADPAAVYSALRDENTVFLESVNGPDHRSERTLSLARYSIIAVDPYLVLRAKDSNITLSRAGKSISCCGLPVARLRELLTAFTVESREGIPFSGGAIGLFSYDFVQYLENLPKTAIDDLKIPDTDFLFTDSVVTVDHFLGRTLVSVLPGPRYVSSEFLSEGFRESQIDSGRVNLKLAADGESYYDAAYDSLMKLCERVSAAGSIPTFSSAAGGSSACMPGVSRPNDERPPLAGRIKIEHEMSESAYKKMVVQAKEYIAAGDIFQANLSQRIRARVDGVDPWRIYLILRSVNPSPFAAFMDMGDYQVVSSSPERLVQVGNGWAETRPIAGTRPRGTDPEDDRRMRAELLINQKERAEHIMLIDLERNDLGKISCYGSVEVNELMVTEDYSHVIHIVSNVRGKILPDKDMLDIVQAVFPGGTITGVPKVRCMEIIDELEPVRRGPYTGSIGYLGFDGRMDLNIVIRTFVVKDGFAYVQAGAGIVADSDPLREHHETLKKAEALVRTLEKL